MKFDQIAGLFLFAGGTEFLILMTIAEARHSGYSISANYVSDLGVGPAASIFNTAAILLGVLVILGAIFVFLGFHRLLITIFLLLTGIGAIGVGVFPENTGIPHNIAASMAFIFGALSAFAGFTVTKTPMRFVCVVMGALAVVALVLFASGNYLGLGPGGMERMIVFPETLWVTAIGGHFMRPT